MGDLYGDLESPIIPSAYCFSKRTSAFSAASFECLYSFFKITLSSVVMIRVELNVYELIFRFLTGKSLGILLPSR